MWIKRELEKLKNICYRKTIPFQLFSVFSVSINVSVYINEICLHQ